MKNNHSILVKEAEAK